MPSRCSDRRLRPAARGFTLFELVVVIVILGVLTAIAVPRVADLGRSSRVASLQALAGVLRSTAINTRVLCKTRPDCDYGNSVQYLAIGGRQAMLNYGWLDSGDSLGSNQIDAWVVYGGFTAVLVGPPSTAFRLDGAPDPLHCAVLYYDAYYRGPAQGVDVVVDSTGC